MEVRGSLGINAPGYTNRVAPRQRRREVLNDDE